MTGGADSSVKRYRDLARHPHKNGLERELLLDGAHLLIEAARSALTIDSAAFDARTLSDPATRLLAEQLQANGTEILITSKKTIDAMSPVRTPSGVVAIARRSLTTLDRIVEAERPLIVVAHDIQDPGNVGGIMRTAESAGATAVVATPGTADPLSWKALRGSMGSALRLPLVRAGIEEVLDQLRRHRVEMVALVPRDGVSLYRSDLRRPTALLLGAEGAGLTAEIVGAVDHRVSIPMCQPVESLNVGVAAALVLYEAFRQRSL